MSYWSLIRFAAIKGEVRQGKQKLLSFLRASFVSGWKVEGKKKQNQGFCAFCATEPQYKNHIFKTEMQERFLCKSAKERWGETAVTELWDLLEKMEWVCSQIIHNKWSFEPTVFGGFFVASKNHRPASNCTIPPAWYHLDAKTGIKLSDKN